MNQSTTIKSGSSLGILLLLSWVLHAKNDTIWVEDYKFNPDSITAGIGDVIVFKNAATGGTIHNTSSTSVPSGAVSWNQDIDNVNSPEFKYTITHLGLHQYKCKYHDLSHNMVGVIHVVINPSVKETEKLSEVRVLSNPFREEAELLFDNNLPERIKICDITGKTVDEVIPEPNRHNIILNFDASGGNIFFCRLYYEKSISNTIRLIRQ